MSARVSKQKLKEAVRLRVEENMSTPQIAKRLRVCNHTIYKTVKDHPWRRTRQRVGHGKEWTTEDIAVVAALYASSPRSEIEAALPGRSWGSIGQRACSMGIRRDPRLQKKIERAVPSICDALRRERERRGLSRPQLSAMSGLHYVKLAQWETGVCPPNLRGLSKWAASLGMEIAASPLLVPLPVVPVPPRARLVSVTSPPKIAAPVITDDAALIAEYLARRGVTRCPTAAVELTQASIPKADAAAVRAYDDARQAARAAEHHARTHKRRRA